MKKQIIMLMLLISSLAATSAFASRAREAVLGTNDPLQVLSAGSFFAADERNIFFNPSYVNEFKNFVTIEKSNGSSAEGGFFTSMMNFNLGFYFNRANAFDNATYTTTTNLRPFEIFVGSDMGVKWGLGLSFANKSVSNTGATGVKDGGFKDANDEKIMDTTVRLGAEVMDFEPFVAVKVQGSDKHANTNSKTSVEDKNSGFTVGTKYHYGEWSPFAYFQKKTYTEGDRKDSGKMGSNAGFGTGSKGGKVEYTNMGIGVGRMVKASENVRLNYAISYQHGATKSSPAADGATSSENKQAVIPLDLSLEGDAASWLVLRAGLQYKLYNHLSTGGTNSGTQPDDTTGRMGATAKFGKMDFDWAIGNSGAGDTETADTKTFGFDRGFFTEASLTFHL